MNPEIGTNKGKATRGKTDKYQYILTFLHTDPNDEDRAGLRNVGFLIQH